MSAKKVILGILDLAVKVIFVIVVVMLISKYSKVAYNYGYRVFNQVPVSSGTGRNVTITVKEGDSVDTIAEKLASAGLITDKRLFKLQEKVSDYSGMEAPGTYELSTSMTPEEMLQIMASGTEETESSDSNTATSEETPEVQEANEETNGG